MVNLLFDGHSSPKVYILTGHMGRIGWCSREQPGLADGTPTRRQRLDKVFIDKASGNDTHHPQLQAVLDFIDPHAKFGKENPPTAPDRTTVITREAGL